MCPEMCGFLCWVESVMQRAALSMDYLTATTVKTEIRSIFMEKQLLGERIRYYRKKMGVSQAALAEKLFVTAQNLSKWENGLSSPDIWNLSRLADIFNVSCDYLLGRAYSEKHQRVLLAVDGGGTKTEFLLFLESGEVLKHVSLPGSNPNSCGLVNTFDVLKNGIGGMLTVCDSVMGIYLGISGCGNSENQKKIKKFMNENFAGIPCEIQSDLYNAIYMESSLENYVTVICGTGSIIAARTQDKIHKIGGYGYLFDEECCGYEMGRKAILETLRCENGMEGSVLITELVQSYTGHKLLDSIPEIYSSGKDYIASFSRILFEAYDKGDKKAEKIIEESLQKLSYLICFALERYCCGGKVILTGGMTKRADVLLKYLEKYCPNAEFVVAQTDQIYGAAVYCCKQFGKVTPSFAEKLKRNLNCQGRRWKC